MSVVNDTILSAIHNVHPYFSSTATVVNDTILSAIHNRKGNKKGT